jgi:cbb3-type cytochrome oxidase subunit 3
MDWFTTVAMFCQEYSVVLMSTVFVLLIATVLWPGRRERFDRDAQIPLKDDR